ncbi:hypothetical protein [Tahibacter soli]|uniref:Uncharacterized protein n=1 Tax=Tahibacter soli TaxID=2983605 RepID=A0A9X4BHV9_9GAMM|nr:hypothetical protein [Tahibacter soli]MDC8011562.1 hypothetical protein [Tahibacter soli]
MSMLAVDLVALKRIMCDLDYLAISLDRIGSEQMTKDERIAVHDRFMEESDLARRILFARKILSVAIDEGVSREELAEIDEAVERVRPWDMKNALMKK